MDVAEPPGKPRQAGRTKGRRGSPIRGVLEGGLGHSLTDAALTALPWPLVDVVERPDAYLVSASLPGLRPEDVDVTLNGETLTLRGNSPAAKAAGAWVFRERHHGPFERVVALPLPVDATAASSELADGVLSLRLPKLAAVRERHLSVDPSAACRPGGEARANVPGGSTRRPSRPARARTGGEAIPLLASPEGLLLPGDHHVARKVNPIQVQKFLKRMDYPASKEALLATARENGADGNVVATLERLPEGPFARPIEVSEAIGRLE